MSTTELTETLNALHRLEAKVCALELGVLHRAEIHELGPDAETTDTASW